MAYFSTYAAAFFFFAGSALAAPTSTTQMNQRLKGAENTVINDFLIQDVCVDANDRPIEGNPATCAKHRNVRAGELVPYLHTDYGPNGARYQAVASYPVVGRDGLLKVMVSKSMRARTKEFSSFTFNYQHLRDGFDLLETTGEYVSGIRTSDGGCGDQIIKKNAWEREDGWIFFPSNQNRPQANMNHTIRMERLNPPAACHAANNYNYVSEDTEAHTQVVWDVVPFNYRYQSGRSMATIDSYHVAHWNLSQQDNAIEKFFFTKEYGFTRWEAWIPLSRCYAEGHWFCNDPNMNLRGRCDGGGVTSWGGQTWVRTDCRDSTNYLATTPFLPLATNMAESDIDSQSAITMSQAVAAIPGLYRDILGREPDAAGLASHHHGVILSGRTAAELKQAFVSSEEAALKIRQLAIDVLGRNPSSITAAQARSYWGASLNSMSLADLRKSFANSEEAANKVKAAYKSAFGKEIDAATLKNYLAPLAAGSKTLQAIRNEIQVASKSKCEISLSSCPLKPAQKLGTFLDNYDGSSSNQSRCLARAQEYKTWCGAKTPVKASFYVNGAVKGSITK